MRLKDEKGRFVRQPMLERFWDYVDKSGPDKCWLWTGPVNSVGYGRFTDYWQKYLAHRVSYEEANGPIPEGKNVCHTCDIRRCVNPAHLWLGSHSDNMQDAAKKGRLPGNTTPKPGMENARSKLTDDQVREIRKRYEAHITEPKRYRGTNPNTIRGLAEEYGVATSLIHRIVRGKVWTHL